MLPTLMSRAQLPTHVIITTNPSVNPNTIGDRAMTPSDIRGPITEISRGVGVLLLVKALDSPLFTFLYAAPEESSWSWTITEMAINHDFLP